MSKFLSFLDTQDAEGKVLQRAAPKIVTKKKKKKNTMWPSTLHNS